MAPARPASASLGPFAKGQKMARRNLAESRLETVAGDHPLTEQAKSLITEETTRLIHQRKQLRNAIVQDFERRPRWDDKIVGRELRKLARIHIRREKAYMAHMDQLTKELQRRQRQDSAAFSADLHLVQTQVQRFERPLRRPKRRGSSERQTKAGDEKNDDEKKTLVSAHTTSEVATSHHSKRATVDPSSENEVVEKQRQASPVPAMYGAFDDEYRPQGKKRKREYDRKDGGEAAHKIKEPRAKGTSSQPSPAQSPLDLLVKAAFLDQDAVSDGNMSRSKQGKMKDAAESKHQYPTSKNGHPIIRVSGRSYEVEKAPKQFDVESDDDEPEYKKIARAMLDPDYNDHVHKLARKKRPSHNKYVVSGALMDEPESKFPTPPASDEAENNDRKAFHQKRPPFTKRASAAARANRKARRIHNKTRSTGNAP